MNHLISESEWLSILDGLRQGDAAALQRFCAKCGPMLRAIADRRVAPKLQSRFDADDVVQSTFRTFIRRAHGGQFLFDDNQRLWNLLCAITFTKLREKARFHQRQSRSALREQPVSENESGNERPFLASPGPSPDAAAEFADEFQHVLGELDDSERRLVELKLQDRTNDEAAEAMGVSERTVRRMLTALQLKFGRLLR